MSLNSFFPFKYARLISNSNNWPVSTIGSVSDYEGPLDRAHQEVAGSSPVLVILFLHSQTTPPSYIGNVADWHTSLAG